MEHREGYCDLCGHSYDDHDMSKMDKDRTACWRCPNGACQ